MGKVFMVEVAEGVQQVKSVKEAVAVLKANGVDVRQKDILAGEVEQVKMVDEADITPVLTEGDKALTDTQEGTDAPTDTQEPEAGKPADNTPEDIEYPEVGHFKDEKAMKKYVKKLSDDQLFEWCGLEGVTWKECVDHASINRMRAAMAIKALHFPHTAPKASNKSKSKYSDYKTEDLVQMAVDNDIYVTGDNGDMRILRMKTIMALRDAGIIV